jgi:hypothetical protein
MLPDLPQDSLFQAAASLLVGDPYVYLTIALIKITLVTLILLVKLLRRGRRDIAFYVKIFSALTSIIVNTLIFVFLISRAYTTLWKVCGCLLWWFSHLFGVFFDVKKILRRRSAANNSHSVHPKATSEELAAFDDLCAICMAEMTEAAINKKLPCSHIFHNSCLRPWFQIRLVCPTCSRSC